MRRVPTDVEGSIEFARASGLTRFVWAEVRPAHQARTVTLAEGVEACEGLARVTARVGLVLRPAEAYAVWREGETLGLWVLVDRPEGRSIVIESLPPSLAKRPATTPESGGDS